MRLWFPLLTLAIAHVAAASPLYTVTPLASLGGNGTSAFAINNLGEAAGYGQDANGNVRAFHAGEAGFDQLGIPGARTQAAGINDLGEVAGTTYRSFGARATVWEDGAALDLGTLGGADSYGLAVNDQGMVAGGSLDARGYQRAFLWQDGAMHNLGTLPGTTWSAAYALNDAGQVAGYTLDAAGRAQAFMWSGTTGMAAVAGAGSGSYAMGINDQGAVVGHTLGRPGGARATLWEAGREYDLGTLGGASFAYGINQGGDAVGYSYASGAQYSSATLYRDGAALDLNSALVPSVGWILEAAYAINDAGQIVGTGLWQGQSTAFRLDPVQQQFRMSAAMVESPEPGTWVLALLGVLLVLLGRSLCRVETPPED